MLNWGSLGTRLCIQYTFSLIVPTYWISIQKYKERIIKWQANHGVHFFVLRADVKIVIIIWPWHAVLKLELFIFGNRLAFQPQADQPFTSQKTSRPCTCTADVMLWHHSSALRASSNEAPTHTHSVDWEIKRLLRSTKIKLKTCIFVHLSIQMYAYGKGCQPKKNSMQRIFLQWKYYAAQNVCDLQ